MHSIEGRANYHSYMISNRPPIQTMTPFGWGYDAWDRVSSVVLVVVDTECILCYKTTTENMVDNKPKPSASSQLGTENRTVVMMATKSQVVAKKLLECQSISYFLSIKDIIYCRRSMQSDTIIMLRGEYRVFRFVPLANSNYSREM